MPLPQWNSNRVNPASERQWSEMATLHATALEAELRGLDEQLRQIAPAGADVSQPDAGHIQIDSPGDFARAASRLLRQMQNLNRSVGISFASGTSDKAQGPDALLKEALHSIPLQGATDMALFATRLADSKKTVNSLDQLPSRR